MKLSIHLLLLCAATLFANESPLSGYDWHNVVNVVLVPRVQANTGLIPVQRPYAGTHLRVSVQRNCELAKISHLNLYWRNSTNKLVSLLINKQPVFQDVGSEGENRYYFEYEPELPKLIQYLSMAVQNPNNHHCEIRFSVANGDSGGINPTPSPTPGPSPTPTPNPTPAPGPAPFPPPAAFWY